MPKQKFRFSSIAIACLITLGIASVVGGFALVYCDWPKDSESLADAGPRGDFWGGHIGAAASLAGTFFFVATLLLQTQELQAQRQELRETRAIAQGQEDALRRQNEIADKTAVFQQTLKLAEFRLAEYQGAERAANGIDPVKQTSVSSLRDLEIYARHRMRFIAVSKLITELLSNPALSKTERTQVLIFSEMYANTLPAVEEVQTSQMRNAPPGSALREKVDAIVAKYAWDQTT